MNTHLTPPLLAPLLVLADHGHLRIYRLLPSPGRNKAHLEVALSADYPRGHEQYFEEDSDKAGRFPGNSVRGHHRQMSIDERLPMQREHEQRIVRDLSEQIEGYMVTAPDLAWYLSASPQLEHSILQELSPGVRSRLISSAGKNLIGMPVDEIVAHFPMHGEKAI
ncbi:MAG: host attachment protein [Opitutaceae bacterium]|nr:host attachment protein [Opitutaceae bacterium]